MTHDSKIIIIDIDFHKVNKVNADMHNNMGKLLQQISGDQNLIILTDDNLHDARIKCDKLGIRSGHLISNSGAVIFNIGSAKTMFQKRFHLDEVKMIAHIATLKDLIVIIHNKDGQKISYKLNNWFEKHLNNETLNSAISCVKIYDYWKKFISELELIEVNSIEIYFPNNSFEAIDENRNDFLLKIRKIVEVDIFSQANSLFITPKNATRLNAVKKMGQILKLDLMNNSLYVGATSFFCSLVQYTYISVTSREVEISCQGNGARTAMPTLYLNNSIDSWIHWLTDNDYLWAYEPKNDVLERLKHNPQNQKTSNLKISDFALIDNKKISLKQNTVKIETYQNNSTSKTHLINVFKTKKSTMEIRQNNRNAWETLVVWKENWDEISAQLNENPFKSTNKASN